MPKDKSYYLLFRSIHDVLRAERILKEKGIAHELVPVPRNLSSDCGMSIRLDSDAKGIRQYLGNIEIERSFSCDGDNYEQVEL